MKNLRGLLFALSLFTTVSSFAQQPTEETKSPRREPAAQRAVLIRFDLDFPGGTPGALVAAIQKATGRPLNVIIPTEFANQPLPPLKMRGVDVAQLFGGLRQASLAQRVAVSDSGGMRSYTFSTSFSTEDGRSMSDDSIWYFHVEGSTPYPEARPETRFYLLTPYLDQGLTVDDITTAIRTGWKMLGNPNPPAISFHKETKLLIAVGQPSQLGTIEGALRALYASPKPKSAGAPPAGGKPAGE